MSDADNVICLIRNDDQQRARKGSTSPAAFQDTIDDMNLDPAAEAEVIEAFTGAGLLCNQSYPSLL